MGRLPNRYDALDIAQQERRYGVSSGGYVGDQWDPARWMKIEPVNPVARLWHRLRLAWGVFTGKYDALTWGDQ